MEALRTKKQLIEDFKALPLGSRILSTLKDYKQTYTLKEVEGYKMFMGDTTESPFEDGGKILSDATIMFIYGKEIKKN